MPLMPRIKAQLKLAINRLKLLQDKNTAIAKQSRREMAQLMEKGKMSSAKIRVENIINDDIHVELLEALELYCEVALARVGMIERAELDPRLTEAVSVIIYAAPHTDIKELLTLRELFSGVFPKEFMHDAIENTSGNVPEKILKRIHIEAPSTELVDLYLLEIAKAYKVRVSGFYEPPASPEPEITSKSQDKKSDSTNESTGKPSGPAGGPAGAPPKADDLMARFAALKRT